MSAMNIPGSYYLGAANGVADNAAPQRPDVGLFRRMLDQVPVGVMMVDPVTFLITYVNDTAATIFRTLQALLPVGGEGLIGCSIDIFNDVLPYQRELITNPANLPYSTRLRLGDEVLDLSISCVTGQDGTYVGPMLTWSRVTAQVRAEESMTRLARYDILTGLRNRPTFFGELATDLARPRPPGTPPADGLFLVDLDGFKHVNDSYGHTAGDTILGMVAHKLEVISREQGGCVGRMGGDEFALFIPECTPCQAEHTARSIIRAMQEPLTLPEWGRHQIGVSVGIALSPDHGADPTTLLAHAHMALHDVKQGGKGSYRVFVPQMKHKHQRRASLEGLLREAMPHKRDMFVFYQPIVDLTTRRVVAREALIRWHHPERGWISPGDFIPVAEEAGLIQELDAFVFATACREAANWQDGAIVATNVSAACLGLVRLPDLVQAELARTGLPAARLNIEVTETALLRHEADSVRDLQTLHEIGVGICLDDFGTGFSSLSHLRSFPFDKIKIDGSFVQDGDERDDCAAIVRTLAQLGRTLGVETVAEGVETQAQYERVKADGCTLGQGYFFGRPAPSSADMVRVGEIMEAMQKQAASKKS